ncbi:MAG: hypothetical protein LH624_12320, partial [Cryobacterium sp.]|nr:hypothetical protein [Cryobacterium sp.]
AATMMLIGGVAMLTGWKLQLPMIAGRIPTGNGLGSTYGLGLFSRAASSCCAPVLIGVAVLSGATASFPAALAVGLTYVAGMVAPLAILAIVWDCKDWSSSKWLQGRQITSLESDAAKLKDAGIGAVVSITHDPAQQCALKTTDMGLTTPVLSDPHHVATQEYPNNEYGMMGTSTNEHSFILVGPDGTITWRADYGGAPRTPRTFPSTSCCST